MRQSWTDDRLDGLAARMDANFARVDARFDKVDAEFKEVRHQIAEQGKELRGDIRWLGERFDRFQDTIVRGFVSIIVTLIAALLTLNFT